MKHRWKIVRLIPIGLLFLMCISFPSIAAQPRHVLILDIPRFALSDLLHGGLPNLTQLANGGASGIVTNPLSEPLNMEKVYLSINSGTQIKTSLNSLVFFNADELYNGQPAREFTNTFLGVKTNSDSAVNVGNAKLFFTNKLVASKIGLLGKTLHLHQIKTGIIGNADADVLNRSAAAMIMTPRGTVDYGAIGSETLISAPEFPSGFRSDNNRIFSLWKKIRIKTGITIVTLGDLERIERYGAYLTPKRWAALRRQALIRYDPLIGQFMKDAGENTLIILFSPLDSQIDSTKFGRMTNVIISGAGFTSGILDSTSTRHPGLVTCYDLSATVLNHLEIKSQEFFNGNTLKTRTGNWRFLPQTQQELLTNFNLRWPLLTGYGVLMIAVLAFWLIGLFFKPAAITVRPLYLAYLFLLTMPAVFLIESLINPLSLVTAISITIGLAGLIFGFAFWAAKGDRFKIFSLICLISLIIVVIDGFFNGFCELRAFLGYSAVAGARFYGIGNEYMGILLGSFIAFTSLNFEFFSRRRSLPWFASLFLSMVLIFSAFGASVGGGVTALLGLGITVWFWQNRPVRLKEILILISASLLLLALSAWGEFSLHRQTHFGQFINVLKSGSTSTVHEIILRKLLLNLSLILYTPLTLILIGVLLVIPFVFKNPPKALASVILRHPSMARGLIGLSITGLIAILINDSGIVTAATLFLFGIPMLMAATDPDNKQSS